MKGVTFPKEIRSKILSLAMIKDPVDLIWVQSLYLNLTTTDRAKLKKFFCQKCAEEGQENVYSILQKRIIARFFDLYFSDIRISTVNSSHWCGKSTVLRAICRFLVTYDSDVSIFYISNSRRNDMLFLRQENHERINTTRMIHMLRSDKATIIFLEHPIDRLLDELTDFLDNPNFKFFVLGDKWDKHGKETPNDCMRKWNGVADKVVDMQIVPLSDAEFESLIKFYSLAEK